MPRYPKPPPPPTLPTFNPLLRYPIAVAAQFLSQGINKTRHDIKVGRIAVIREGARMLYVPGSESVRLCAPPTRPS